MKIGLILSSAPGYSETFFNYKIKGLRALGHEVTLYCAHVEADFDLCPVVKFSKRYPFLPFQIAVLIRVYFSLLPYLGKVIKFYRLESRNGVSKARIFKLVYFNAPIFKSKLDWLHFGFGTLTLGRESLSKAIGAKMAVSFRGFDIGVYPVKYPNCYDRLWRSVDKIHVISEDIRELLYVNGFKDEVPVVKITPAIDTDVFINASESGLHKPLRLLTVARLHWKKGLSYTLEALSLLKRSGHSFHYTIIGTGEAYEHLVYLVSQLDLSEEVTFIGRLSHLEIKDYMKNADIYIQYSIQEGFCNAVLEAQAMGLLCVVSDAEGLSENVIHKKTGWVVPKRSPGILYRTLREIIQLPKEEQKAIAEHSVSRVKAEFNLESQRRQFSKFYEDHEQ